jgi:peptidyl-prolyl cis-trans isomerase A (cyclophilin A)
MRLFCEVQARRFTLQVALAGLSFIIGACGDTASKSAAVAGPAPDTFRVVFETTRGTFVVEAVRAWAPNGADRFHQLAREHFFDESRFFRVVPGFVAQFGLNDQRKANERWEEAKLPDDSVRQSNARGTIVFTNSGPNTRSHQMFVNLADNARLDKQGFAPFGRVVEGMAVVDSLYNGYEDTPDQQYIRTLGNSYLTRMFPKLDYIRTARIQGAPIGPR